MTSDELRALADAVTPGPWAWTHSERSPWQVGTVSDEDEQQIGGYVEMDDVVPIDFICEGGESAPRADARLIALAPDLARLCAEIAEATRWYFTALEEAFPKSEGAAQTDDYPIWLRREDALKAAVAKLAELEAR